MGWVWIFEERPTGKKVLPTLQYYTKPLVSLGVFIGIMGLDLALRWRPKKNLLLSFLMIIAL